MVDVNSNRFPECLYLDVDGRLAEAEIVGVAVELFRLFHLRHGRDLHVTHVRNLIHVLSHRHRHLHFLVCHQHASNRNAMQRFNNLIPGTPN